jgi:riboflavin-specific deaminase-like protein
MAMSLDGKIATKARGPIKFTSQHDSRRMAEIRAEQDVIINGSGTYRAYPLPLLVKGEDLLRQRMGRGEKKQPASAFVSSRLDVPRATPWEKATEVERWVFCGKEAPEMKISAFEKTGATVVRSRHAQPKPKEILRAFAKAGLNRVLLEGGGEFNAAFLEEDLVDRIYLTMAPVLVGGAESPTWFEGSGFKKFPRFRLGDCKNVDGELFLTYERLAK